MRPSTSWLATGTAALLSYATLSNALPWKRAVVELTDTIILNFALTLEHLENAFYTEALAAFDEAAFEAAGFPAFVRGRFVQISENEADHVEFLTSALGDNATQPCEYSFPLTDPVAFVTLSGVFEGVGTSAYTGALNLLSDKTAITNSAAILATEARQASWVLSAVLKQNPWSTSFETPLDANQALSLATGFIVSCPSTNPDLGITGFPPLNVTLGDTDSSGTAISLQFNTTGVSPGSGGSFFLALLNGLQTTFVPITGTPDNGNATATIPSDLQGTVYAFVTTSGSSATDSDTVAGGAVLQFPFDSQANEQFGA